ncbi:hypothetical protein [Naasia sp. SYSU D00948]|uniref:hypothetical protein n=1 Tax=Naasia sp. SYSU D00948 TaxID=2817379 RepID=UPI001B308495|nr:hypothetical protein [Naasia sp. SYSU D00948]
MKVHKEEIVERLRELGRDEDADRALEELPDRVDLHKFEGKLHSYGLEQEPSDSALHPTVWNIPED